MSKPNLELLQKLFTHYDLAALYQAKATLEGPSTQRFYADLVYGGDCSNKEYPFLNLANMAIHGANLSGSDFPFATL